MTSRIEACGRRVTPALSRVKPVQYFDCLNAFFNVSMLCFFESNIMKCLTFPIYIWYAFIVLNLSRWRQSSCRRVTVQP
jgi:hypothetical protein